MNKCYCCKEKATKEIPTDYINYSLCDKCYNIMIVSVAVVKEELQKKGKPLNNKRNEF